MLHRVDQLDGRGNVHSLIGVHHDFQVISHNLADLGQALHVLIHIRMAHFNFNGLEAALLVVHDLVHQLLLRVRNPAAATVYRNLSRVASQKLPDGLL